MLSKMCSFSLSFVTTEEVMNLLGSLPDEKAAGYDLMDNRLLRYAALQIAAPLRYLFNWSIDTGHLPRVWKKAKLCPKNSKEPVSPENSRPISLLPALSKILKSIISAQIWSYMETSHLLSANQHAYRKVIYQGVNS